jgi:hypothetical protein
LLVIANGYLMFTGSLIMWTDKDYSLSKPISLTFRVKGGLGFVVGPEKESYYGELRKLQSISFTGDAGHALGVCKGLFF